LQLRNLLFEEAHVAEAITLLRRIIGLALLALALIFLVFQFNVLPAEWFAPIAGALFKITGGICALGALAEVLRGKNGSWIVVIGFALITYMMWTQELSAQRSLEILGAPFALPLLTFVLCVGAVRLLWEK
jgi:hypothetical protein